MERFVLAMIERVLLRGRYQLSVTLSVYQTFEVVALLVGDIHAQTLDTCITMELPVVCHVACYGDNCLCKVLE